MKLKKWVEKEEISQADFAKAIKVNSMNVSRWITGASKPGIDNMAKIVAYTKGEVTANDFYGIEEKSE